MQNGKSTKAQPFSEHIRELRRRLLCIIATLFLGCAVGYAIHGPLFNFIRRPLHSQLYYTTPTGGFNAIIKISIMFGLIVTVPVLVYQLCRFLSPVFSHRIRMPRLIILSILLAMLGLTFAYYVSLPAALHFLANIDTNNLQSLITVNEYLNFVGAYLASFAILFQLPLIMLFINRIKPQRPGKLMSIQRYVILFSFVLAAVLTPTPDPINQTIMALPIILLYQFSVGLIWFANRRVTYASAQPAPALVTPVKAEPVAPEPEMDVPERAAGTYSADTYNGPTPLPISESEESPDSPDHKPQLIMDIFGAPQSPAT